MDGVSSWRLWLLRGMYAFIAVGLAVTVWPGILRPDLVTADRQSMINALLGAIALLCALGIRQPLKFLPILLFELCWKLIWVISILPLWLAGKLDAYGTSTLFACMMGVVLVPLVLPWGYVLRTFVLGPSTRAA